MRTALLLLFVTLLTLGAAPKKKAAAPAAIAPPQIEHAMALYLKQLSKDGTRAVTFRATAVGTRFFFEENAGVTVYTFKNGRYVKEELLRGVKLPAAVKRYSGRR